MALVPFSSAVSKPRPVHREGSPVSSDGGTRGDSETFSAATRSLVTGSGDADVKVC